MSWVNTTRPFKQARALQELLFSSSQVKGTKPADLAKLALAWEKLEDRLRILRGRPLPGVFKSAIRNKPGMRPGSKKPWVTKRNGEVAGVVELGQGGEEHSVVVPEVGAPVESLGHGPDSVPG